MTEKKNLNTFSKKREKKSNVDILIRKARQKTILYFRAIIYYVLI